MKNPRGCAFVLICLAVSLVLPSAEARGLKILLTNDDGYDAPGIRAVRQTLMATGHEVTVVAPLEKQSGAGASLTFREKISVKKQAAGIWSVNGSPADCVSIGLRRIMAKNPPDLVVSGANFGQNLGSDVPLSGTVGAAIMATRLRVPAIALSVGLKQSEATAKPRRFSSTHASFSRASQVLAEIILKLDHSRGDGGALIPENILLNINYPPLKLSDMSGTKMAPLSRSRSYRVDYKEADEPGVLQPSLKLESKLTPKPGSDHDLFAKGFITISMLEGSIAASKANVDRMAKRLKLGNERPIKH